MKKNKNQVAKTNTKNKRLSYTPEEKIQIVKNVIATTIVSLAGAVVTLGVTKGGGYLIDKKLRSNSNDNV